MMIRNDHNGLPACQHNVFHHQSDFPLYGPSGRDNHELGTKV